MLNKKQVDIELMRVIAAFWVIFVHTGKNGLFLFASYPQNSIQFWGYMLISIFSKFSSNLFFAIAGALLLTRDPEPFNRLMKRVWKSLFILIIWTAFYYLVNKGFNVSPQDIYEFIKKFVTSKINFSYWFLYAYLVLLLILPILQRLAKSLTNREYLYIFALALISSIIPIIEYSIWQGKTYFVGDFKGRLSWITRDIFIYPLLGYFLKERIKDFWNGKRVTLLWIINIACGCLAAYMTYYRGNIMGEITEGKSQMFHNTFALIKVTSVFVTCQYLYAKTHFSKWIEKAICSIGGCTFGIYLLHIYLKGNKGPLVKVSKYLYQKPSPLGLDTMTTTFIFVTIVFITGYIITIIMKRLPILKKLV